MKESDINARIQWAVLSLAWVLGVLGKQQRFIHPSSSCCIPRGYRLQLGAALELWTDSLQHIVFEMICFYFSFAFEVIVEGDLVMLMICPAGVFPAKHV